MRIQTNLLAAAERRLLNALCRRAPAFVTPDGLTLVGLFGGLLVLVGDGAGRGGGAWLWLAVLGLGLHWLGDSLDGSLARARGVERPRYGLFVDHATDALSNFLIMAGLGLTGFVRMDVALFAYAAYLMLTVYVLLRAQALNEFQLTFLVMGPTELRVILAAMALGMIAHAGAHPVLAIAGQAFTAYDLLVAFGGVVMVGLFTAETLRTALSLRRDGR